MAVIAAIYNVWKIINANQLTYMEYTPCQSKVRSLYNKNPSWVYRGNNSINKLRLL